MNLEEAIIYCEEMAHGNKVCEQCAVDHMQLAEWLKELKELKDQEDWILVADKMPEEREWIGTEHFGTTISDEVYVTFETPKGERFTEHLMFQNGKLSPHDSAAINAFYEGSIPIAWKPLPKAYRGEKRN